MTETVNSRMSAQIWFVAFFVAYTFSFNAIAGDGSFRTPPTGTAWIAENSDSQGSFRTETYVVFSNATQYRTNVIYQSGYIRTLETLYGFFPIRGESELDDGRRVVSTLEVNQGIAASLFPLEPNKTVRVPAVFLAVAEGSTIARENALVTVKIGQKSSLTIADNTFEVFEAQVAITTDNGLSLGPTDMLYSDDLGIPLKAVLQSRDGPLTYQITLIVVPNQPTDNPSLSSFRTGIEDQRDDDDLDRTPSFDCIPPFPSLSCLLSREKLDPQIGSKN